MILIHLAILKIYLKNDITIYKYVHFEQIFFLQNIKSIYKFFLHFFL